jgi:hypothetical protein
VQEAAPEIALGKLMLTGASTTMRAPFRTLLSVELLITLVAATIPANATDASAILGGLVLVVVSAVLQIAILLAAAESEPGRSADAWVVAALRKRRFWRFALTRVLTTVMVVLGVALVVVLGARLPVGWLVTVALATALGWGFVVGSVIGVAEQAAVLERRWPFDAMGRSAELTRPARQVVGLLFALVVVLPNVVADRLLGVDLLGSWGILRLLPAVAAIVVSTGGLIALTKAYIGLGGTEIAARSQTTT